MWLVLFYNFLCSALIVLFSALVRKHESSLHFLFAESAVSIQLFNLLIFTGFACRSSLAGLGYGSLLAVASVLGTMIFDMPDAFDAYRSFLNVPFLLTVCALPMLMVRFVWGWQLVDLSSDHLPFRRWRTEDFFLITAVAAAMWILLVNSVARFDSRSPFNLDVFGFIAAIITTIFSSLVCGYVNLYFRHKLDVVTMFHLLLAVFLPQHLLIAFNSSSDAPLFPLLGAPLCALGSLGGLAVYRVAGMRLLAYPNRSEKDESELTEDERLFNRRSRYSARVAAVLFLVAAIAASAMCYWSDSRWAKDGYYERAADEP